MAGLAGLPASWLRGARLRGGLLPLLTALTVALVAAACGGGSDIDVSSVDAVALLQRAADRTAQVERFHFVLDHEHGNTEIVRGLRMERAEGDVDGADRLQIEVTGRAGPLNIEVSIVILGAEAWITNPLTGRWEREQISVAEVFDPTGGVIPLLRSATDPVVARAERVDGVETYRVDATVDSGALTLFSPDATPGRALRASAWIGVDDPLVRRIEVTGALARGERDDLVRRLAFSRFDQDVEIVAPR